MTNSLTEIGKLALVEEKPNQWERRQSQFVTSIESMKMPFNAGNRGPTIESELGDLTDELRGTQPDSTGLGSCPVERWGMCSLSQLCWSFFMRSRSLDCDRKINSARPVMHNQPPAGSAQLE